MQPGTPVTANYPVRRVAARAARAKLTPLLPFPVLPMSLATFGPSLTADFTDALMKCRRYDLNKRYVGPLARLPVASDRHTINCADDLLPRDEVLFLVASRDRGLLQAGNRRGTRLDVVASRIGHVGLLDARGSRFVRLVDHPRGVPQRLDEITCFGCWRAPWPNAEARHEARALLEERLDDELAKSARAS